MSPQFSNKRIPHSPLETPNELENNELGDIRINTGTQSCQSSISLYDTLAELCKEKNGSRGQKVGWTSNSQVRSEPFRLARAALDL